MEFFKKHIRHIVKYALVVAVSLILGIVAYYFTHNALTDMIERSLIEIAKQGAKTIENDIDRRLDNLTTISELDVIRNKNNSIDDKLALLKAVDHSNSELELAFITKEGTLHSVFGKTFDVANEEFFIQAMKGERRVSFSQRPFSRGYLPIAFAVPVYNGKDITGALCALYSSEIFNRLVADITFGKQGYGYIINERGDTIAHKDRSLVENRVNSIFDARSDSSLTELAVLEELMILGKTDSGSYTYLGQKKYMGFTKIQNMPWSFAATTPMSEAFNNANPILTFMASVACIFGLVLLFITIYFAVLNRKIRHEEQSLKSAIETANIIIISFLEDGVILDFNVNAEERFGYTQNEVVKTLRIHDFLNLKDQKKLKKIIEDNNNGIKESNFELGIRTQEGEARHVIFNLNVLDRDDAVIAYELMGVDISDRVKSEVDLIEKHEELSAVYEELAASEEELKDQLDELIQQKIMLQEKDQRHNLVVEASNIGIWDWDMATNSHFYSDKWYEIFDMTKDDFKGKEQDWLDFVLPEDRRIARFAYDEHLEKKTPYYECEYRIKTSKGNIKWVYTVGKALWDADGNPVKMAGSYTDISPRKEIEEKVKRLAYYDSLTGLSNRSKLIDNFNAIKAKTDGSIALIFIDLENFKLINDSYGHNIGDKLLIAVSKRLREICTDKMYISRLGGDEFTIMVWDYKSEEALTEFVENLIYYLEGFIKINEYNINLSITIGISLYPKDADNFDDLLKNADTAMYKANEKLCKYVFYNQEMNDAIVERLNLRNSLKAALDHGEFLLYYQPQYWSRDKSIMGLEALVRWKSKSMGLVSPAKFIPIAEESKLIIPLGDWILEEALKFLRKVHDQGHRYLIMSVNISPIQLIQRNFAETVLCLLEKYELYPDNLELEITESAMMESVELVLHNIIILRNKGVRIALDDFGTGYSSLNYLTKIPINTLKIDKSFIDNIGQVKEKSLLISSIVDIGRKLGLSIVAEGVETENQFDYLQRRHCERIQGYLFSRPLPEEEVLRLMD